VIREKSDEQVLEEAIAAEEEWHANQPAISDDEPMPFIVVIPLEVARRILEALRRQ